MYFCWDSTWEEKTFCAGLKKLQTLLIENTNLHLSTLRLEAGSPSRPARAKAVPAGRLELRVHELPRAALAAVQGSNVHTSVRSRLNKIK